MDYQWPFNMSATRKNTSLVLLLSCIGHLMACSTQHNPARNPTAQIEEAVVGQKKFSIDDSNKVVTSFEFEGQWSYRDDCDRGHYVTLELRREGDQIIGAWSDGTQLRGSEGLLKGKVAKDRLIAEWCSKYEEVGAPAVCPHYDWLEDYLAMREGKIVWYQKYGQEYSEYVVLTQGDKPHRSTKECEEGN